MKQLLISLILCSQLLPLTVQAVSDDFIFRISVSDDVVPPTTPTLLAVDPVSDDQIDIVWSSSTDDELMGGYVVLRDGTPIATTTLTNYSDTGLLAETLYSYAVYAFDALYNISTTSNSLATTTLAAPVVPPTPSPVEDESSTQSTLVTRIGEFSVTTDTNEVTLSFTTNTPVRYLLRWGRTDAYTGGYVSSDTYQTAHVTSITDLEPGTRYEFMITGYTPAGRAVALREGFFVTDSVALPRVVENVSRLTATVVGEDVLLTYRLPETEPGARVRVVRSYLGFPRDLLDGALVYEGQNTTVSDIGALRTGLGMYYTVFVVTADGTVSSGAVVWVERATDAVVGESGATSTDETQVGVDPSTPGETILIPLLESSEIVVTQGRTEFTFLNEEIILSSTDPFTIQIDRTALPRHLKSIIVSLQDPTDQRKRYAFLLRLNPAGTAYEATISPFAVLGESRLTIEVYDYDQLIVGRYSTLVTFVRPSEAQPVVIFPDMVITWLRPLLEVAGAMVVIMALLLFFLWRRRRDEDKA